ncbi:MAG TPA: peroxiredoxin-like family protein [Kofleriaceae bacterium]|nr:peroxiredoxin-like family protein [Kofleriaceae bacterium]
MQLHRDIGKIQGAGAELYVIGNGTPSFIEGFREQTKYDGPLYTDPSLEVYKAAELKRGVTKVLNIKAALPTLKAFAKGGKQGLTQGDAWQQGGVVVVASDGSVKWQHASGYPGDNASVEQIVRALR